MDSGEHITRFDLYCQSCKYKDTPENLNPCDECLKHPVNFHTYQPFCYEKRS